MKEVSVDKYNSLINLQKENGTNYSEHIKGSRKILKVGKRIVCATSTSFEIDLGEISSAKFIGFIASFKRNLYYQMEKNPDSFFKIIQFTGYSKNKNRELWNKINVGDKFWNIDLSSAYWQMGYRLGYISNNVFKKYLNQDDYKQAKRLCFTFLARKSSKKYFSKNKELIIECENSIEQNIYNNVRNELYNLIANCKAISNEFCLEHNIDGITIICPEKKQEVIDYLKSENLFFKINEGIKISKDKFFIKSKIKKF
jgi:hypothetical protein